MKVGIIGLGSWGTALGQVLSDNDHEVIIWGRSEAEVLNVNDNHQLSYFPDVILNPKLKATVNINDLSDCKVIIIATPSSALESVIKLINETIKHKIIIINVSKGFYLNTNQLLSEAIESLVNKEILIDVVNLIGPTHAEEVVLRLETAIVAVSKNLEVAKEIQHLFSNDYFRVYINDDVIGAQIGAALKNVIALASGILAGLNLGDNARAALITRGLTEIRRLGNAMGGQDQTFFGLTGMGDLIVTATSLHSRNYEAGYKIGKANSAKEFLLENKKTVEGINAVKIVMELAKKYDVSMPISTEVYNIVFNGEKPSDSILNLMNRSLKKEK